MARTFKGRFSQELYNEKLNELYEIIKDINNESASTNIGPDNERQGALWLNMKDNGELRYRENGAWKNIFNDKFRIVCEMLFTEEPENPVQGQLWLRDGVLCYRKDNYWIPIKAVNVATDFNESVYEPFLIVGPMKASGNQVVEEGTVTVPTIKTLYKQEEFLTSGDAYNQTFILRNGTYTKDSSCIFIYINGIRIPSDQIIEASHNSFILKDCPENILQNVIVPSPGIELEYKVLAEYINLKDAQELLVTYVEKDGEIFLTKEQEEAVTVLYSQFLIPSEELDRVFLDGIHIDDDVYEVVTNIAIQYPTEKLQGKQIMAVHVNPTKLTNIQKRIFIVDKKDPFIPVPERYTEYYGLKGGVGKFLIKTKGQGSEYKTVTGGIKLSKEVAEAYDFVMTHTYEFTNVKHVGSLTKKKAYLGDGSAIYIGKIEDPICVFAQGLYLSEDSRNYTYDYEKGYLTIQDIESKTDIGVVAFYKKEEGQILSLNEDGYGIININKDYRDKLVFVYGLGLNTSLADYEVDPKDPKKIYVKNAKINMRYAIVELNNSDDDLNLRWLEGKALEDESTGEGYIQMPEDDLINFGTECIVIANGLLVRRREVEVDTANQRIYVPNLKPGMDYIVLKDLEGRYIYSGDVTYNTIALGTKCDSAIVYLNTLVIPDNKAVIRGSLPRSASHNETVVVDKQWYVFNSGWQPIEDPEQVILNNHLLNGYSHDDYSVSILKNCPGEKLNLLAYQYANSVEQPLLRGNITTREGIVEYRTAFNHSFPLGRNCLSIWQNGLRQNHNTNYVSSRTDLDLDQESMKNFELNGYQEKEGSRFLMPEGIDGGIFYVVELPEGSEYRTCEREVLTQENRRANSNTYRTTLDLYSGVLRVFVSGIRQTEKDYEVIDSNNIMFFTDHNDEEETHQDTILIEIRPDYKLREMTVLARHDGQWQYDMQDPKSPNGGDGLLPELIYSSDFIMIYINGLAYGANYKVENEKILLLDSYIKDIIKAGDKITFEWR